MPRPPLSLRSRLSLLLLLILREAPAPSHYLAYHLGEEPRKISRYLTHLRRLGLVERDEYGIWYVTEKGRELIERYMRSLDALSRIVEQVRLATKIRGNTRESKAIQGNPSLSTLQTVFERAERLLGRPLTRLERLLIGYLLDFTERTGRKYWWPPEPVPLPLALAEELERVSGNRVSPADVEQALRELEARGVVFVAFDRRRGVAKVRLSRSLVDGNA